MSNSSTARPSPSRSRPAHLERENPPPGSRCNPLLSREGRATDSSRPRHVRSIPTNDLKLTFRFSGPTVTPAFFSYELTEVSGWLEYKNNRLNVAYLACRHGSVQVNLSAGEVRFYPNGAVWANLGGIEMKPVVPDEALKKAARARQARRGP